MKLIVISGVLIMLLLSYLISMYLEGKKLTFFKKLKNKKLWKIQKN